MTTPISQFPRPGLPGAVNSNPVANFLKVFGGEVFSNFAQENKLLATTSIKNVSGGAISWTFPAVGTATVSYHTPGSNILTDTDAAGRNYLNKILSNQRTINMDLELTASIFVHKLDRKLNHWDVMSPYAAELGKALSRTVDTNISRMLYNIGNTASDTNMTVYGTGSPGGPSVGGTYGSTRIALSTAFASVTPAQLVKALSNMKVAFDKKGIPRDGRIALMPPEVMQRLLMDANGVVGGTANGLLQWVNTDYNPSGNGSFASGRIPMLFGFQLIEHANLDFPVSTATYGVYDFSAGQGGTGAVAGNDDNLFTTTGNLPITFTNESVTVASSNDYSAAYTAGTTEPYIFCYTKEAIGTVKLEDEGVESEYKLEYRGDLIIASMTLAHGVKRPECVGLICNV